MIDTWNCDICKKEREDEFISVFKNDVSEKHNLPEGSFVENIKYCNDDLDCSTSVRDYTHFKEKKPKVLELEAGGYIKSQAVNKVLTHEEIEIKKEKKNKIVNAILTILLLFLAYNTFISIFQQLTDSMTFWESFFYWKYFPIRLGMTILLYLNISYFKK